MNKELLSLVPKKFLCPYCGKWHDWPSDYELRFFESDFFSSCLECPSIPLGCNTGNYKFYFYKDFCYFYVESICKKVKQSIEGEISIDCISEGTDKPIVTFSVPFKTKKNVGDQECLYCSFKDKCLYRRLGDEGDNRHMTITFGFEFDKEDFIKFKEKKENVMIENNLLNTSLEFGPNKDENISSTLMGIAVKNDEGWRIYDKNKKEITAIGNIQLGNFPLFVLPSTKVSEGDLIKVDGEYYFVTENSDKTTQTISAKTGEIKNVVPIKNIFGFSCYLKIISINDLFDIGDVGDMEKIALISALSGQPNNNGNQMNQILPLLLLKDNNDENDDMKKLLMFSTLSSTENSKEMNQILPLLLFKDEQLGKKDDTTKLLLMSMMSNNTDSDNPLMNFLVLDKFMNKKESE